jgi:hypothetical protein
VTRAADLPVSATVESDRDSDRGRDDSGALITERAQAIARGPQAGSDDENWLLAERQLRAEGGLD